MCDPATAAIAASAGVQAKAAYNSVKAANIAAEYNAKIMENNAALAREKANINKEKGEEQARRHRLKISKLKGTQRSAFASSGVVVDSGSALDVLLDTVQTEQLDAIDIKRNASIEVWQSKASAQNFEQQANLSRLKRRNAFDAAFASALGSGASILGSAGRGG